jgi:hypothetical protein
VYSSFFALLLTKSFYLILVAEKRPVFLLPGADMDVGPLPRPPQKVFKVMLSILNNFPTLHLRFENTIIAKN